MLCGVPITIELVLRVVLLALTVGVLGAASLPKIRSILQQSNVVSVSMTDSNQIQVPSTLICGLLLDDVDVQTVTRGRVYPDGTLGPDIVRPVDSSKFFIVPSPLVHLVYSVIFVWGHLCSQTTL